MYKIQFLRNSWRQRNPLVITYLNLPKLLGHWQNNIWEDEKRAPCKKHIPTNKPTMTAGYGCLMVAPSLNYWFQGAQKQILLGEINDFFARGSRVSPGGWGDQGKQPGPVLACFLGHFGIKKIEIPHQNGDLSRKSLGTWNKALRSQGEETRHFPRILGSKKAFLGHFLNLPRSILQVTEGSPRGVPMTAPCPHSVLVWTVLTKPPLGILGSKNRNFKISYECWN